MELQLQILWLCGYCKNKNFECSTYCSSCFIPFEHQPKVLLNEFYKKRILHYWIESMTIELPIKAHKLIWNFFEDKHGIQELFKPQRLHFGSFYSAGAYYTKYCDGKKWHKSLGECDVDKYQNVNVYDCTSSKDDGGHILFHFGFLKENCKSGDYSFDYETKGVYYYVRDGTVLET
eukprot:149938_1